MSQVALFLESNALKKPLLFSTTSSIARFIAVSGLTSQLWELSDPATNSSLAEAIAPTPATGLACLSVSSICHGRGEAIASRMIFALTHSVVPPLPLEEVGNKTQLGRQSHIRPSARINPSVPPYQRFQAASLPRSPAFLPTDPRFGLQWYLHNTGQTGGTAGIDLNVISVWSQYSGRGVRVAVIDDGIQHTHPDLQANYDATRDYDAGQGDEDAAPVLERDNHGTAIAGIIAATHGNGIGAVGVAFGSRLSGLRIDFSGSGASQQFANALVRMVDFDVVNNSWGHVVPFADSFTKAPFQSHAAALETAARQGRGGLGTVIVFAGGNTRTNGGNTNTYSHQNSRFVITVAALNHYGIYAPYSNPGASLLVSALGGDGVQDGILTTDRTGAAGYAARAYHPNFTGTSAAAPMVSGVVALMLEANPQLGYRDVQEILAYSARQNDPSSSGWAWNGANHWNGGGLHISHDYGFGLVDARAAVRLAETWTAQSTAANEQVVSLGRSPALTIPDLGEVSDALTITRALQIDRVEVSVDISHPYNTDLEVVLRSPAGTESLLLPANPLGDASRDLKFTFSSTRSWGENSLGNWTLTVRDRSSTDSGILNGWTLRLYGDRPSADNTYFYTDAFAQLTEPSRRTLVDPAGIDTINASTVTHSLNLDLTPGSTSQIAGTALVLNPQTVIENAIGGDYADVLRGNSASNTLQGMRGTDWIEGGAGHDTLVGGQGSDTLVGGAGSDRLTGGMGKDRFWFSTEAAFDPDNLGIDTITDFAPSRDKIVLSRSTFHQLRSAIGTGFSRQADFATVSTDLAAATSPARIVYNQSSGSLFYNANGRGAGWGTGAQFALLSGAPSVTAEDFLLVD